MDFRNRLVSHGVEANGFRMFRPIVTRSGITVSIQASKFHYSRPREVLVRPEAYEAWEVGIHADAGTFPFPWENWEVQPGLAVAGYVPTATVQAIVDYLDSLPVRA